MQDLPVLNSKRILLEVALYLEHSGDTVEDICERNQITPENLQVLLQNPIFTADLRRVREEVREHGLTFRVKARTMAEELLKTTWQITQDSTASPAVKADLIKAVVEWGDLKPKSKDANVNAGGGVRIMINFAPEREHDVKTIEAYGIPEVLPSP